MHIYGMLVFYHVATLKNFSKAAEKLAIAKSSVSKCVAALEKDLKSRLLVRTTRKLSLTDAGEIFYRYCHTIVEQAEQGYDAISNLRRRPAGDIKISVPPAFAMHFLTDFLATFCANYPEIKLHVVLESRFANIIEEGYDLLIRSAVLSDSNLVVQKLISFNNILCVSPKYLRKHGAVKSIEDLKNAYFAIYSGSKLSKKIYLKQGERRIALDVNNYFQSDNLSFIKQLVLAGCYMAVFPEFMVKKEISQKKLIQCIPSYQFPESSIYLLYPDKEFMPLKLRVFINALKAFLLSI